MVNFFKKVIIRITQSIVVDILLAPLVFVASLVMLVIRKIGLGYLPWCKKVLLLVGVMPIRNHYYEPLFDEKDLRRPLSAIRPLPGIDWNIDEQLSILNQFDYSREFEDIPDDFVDEKSFHFKNDTFESGDAEYWYNIIRLKKPKTIIEIGSGQSTKIAQLAIKNNQQVDPAYQCEHICVEPYENPWLEELGITIVREKVEDIDQEIFKKMGVNDILFIDSSHMIRAQGDVLYEYLELLPILNNGVIVHIHDIFSPRDYPRSWVIDQVRFWNEQYLLEAFLTENKKWRIIGAVNFLQHNYRDILHSKCPRLTNDREPGSFYIMKQS